MNKIILRLTSAINHRRNTYSGTTRILGIESRKLKTNHRVFTRYGVGRVVEPKAANHKVIAVDVHGVRRLLNVDKEVFYFVVYQPKLGRFIPIVESDYNYIINSNQPIRFRVTRRGNAILTEDTRKKYEAYALLQRNKNGHQLLKTLIEKGFIIK